MKMADKHVCFVLLWIVLCAHTLDICTAFAEAERHPARDFTRHTLVKPKIYHGREKRQISTTKEKDGSHLHHLLVTFNAEGKDYNLDLVLNKDLIPKGYFTSYQKNGKKVVNKPTAEELDLCHYHGKVRGVPNSWVAVSTCNNAISGVIFDGKELHYIQKQSSPSGFSEKTHYFYKHSDLAPHNKTCGYGGDALDHDHLLENNRIKRYKREAPDEPTIRGPYNANRESRYVELVLVVDNREFKDLDGSTQRVEERCKEIANIINRLYAPLNIFIALVGVVIWTDYDEIDFSRKGDTTLTNFLHYRREKLIKEHPNDNAQLLTKFDFDSGVVGKALKGPICTYEYSGGVNTDHSSVIGLVATTIAHEMGHNFGMEHDTNQCKCPEDHCIMAPSSSTVAPIHWSSCSKDYLALAFQHGMDYCLRNKPTSLFDSPVCGNGFVEPGEQCDCGLPDYCDNTCCNATTCTLFSNATCATGECCDLKTCRPKMAGTICRPTDLECDLPEYCTGQSEYCPADVYKMNTELCDGGKAYCYHGFCRTRSDQCKLLWGTTGKSSAEQCYQMNTKGTRHGNCGYNKLNQSYFKCQDENVLCGMLHCKHLNEKLEFGMESVAILSHSFINLKGSIIPCRTAIVDLGINQVDPGLAPDGAKCGDGKMCVNQKCMEISSLRKEASKCLYDCNGNGICNSLGHCHCKDGFAPPYCNYPGFGGSEDSGPASDPDARKGFVTAMFVIFLGIIPVVALLALLSYYARHNIKLTWKKSPAPSVSPSKTRGTLFPSESTKRHEDNHSLLQNELATAPTINNEFFGHFKGFSLTPVGKAEPAPVRAAPPVPVAPSTPAVIKSPLVNRSNTSAIVKPTVTNKPATKAQSFKVNSVSNAISYINSQSAAPALPPPNPGSHARPVISSPILENSTCTAKELMSPLKNALKVPLRPAPESPAVKDTKRPLSSPETVVHTVTFADEVKKPEKEPSGALNRIASFLSKNNEKKPVVNTHSLPRAKKVLDKDALRSIEISNPIPQTHIDISVTTLPVSEANKVVMRAQSMRGTTATAKPSIPNFGSMRQPAGSRRPLSIPSAARPKSPPPPRPPALPEVKKGAQSQYDDCLNEAPIAKLDELSPTHSDNIYAVIEDSPVSPEKVKSGAGSSESMGLLGEIVSEIQNRNFDSIYSTSTINRKNAKKESTKESVSSPDTSEIYVNTSSLYKSPESIYSNMSNLKSSASSTSSGYINPSSVNPPIKPTEPSSNAAEPPKTTETSQEPKKNNFSTFKSDTKPFSSILNRAQGPFASAYKTKGSPKIDDNTPVTEKPATKVTSPPSPTNKPTKTINRQITPPNLRTRKPSPTRPVTPKTTKPSNSPDLVTSCSNSSSNYKSPDVLSNGVSPPKKPVVPPSKPVLPKTVPKINKSVSLKSPIDRKVEEKPPVSAKISKSASDASAGAKVMPVGARVAARQSSNVASLQQKFESKPVIGVKNVTLGKNKV